MFIPAWNCPLCGSNYGDHHYFNRVIGKIWMEKRYEVMPVFYDICRCGMVFQFMRMSDQSLCEYYRGQYRQTIQNGNPEITERVKLEQNRRAEVLLPEIP